MARRVSSGARQRQSDFRGAGGKPVASAGCGADDRKLLTEGCSEAMSQAQEFPHRGSSAHAAELEFAGTLLPLWGFPRNTDVALVDEQGVNNQTFLVLYRLQRYVLRVTGFLTVAEVSAEHGTMSRAKRKWSPAGFWRRRRLNASIRRAGNGLKGSGDRWNYRSAGDGREAEKKRAGLSRGNEDAGQEH
jgi:hypothetical protein